MSGPVRSNFYDNVPKLSALKFFGAESESESERLI